MQLDRGHIIGHDEVPGTALARRSPTCTGTRAPTGTGRTTWTCSARRGGHRRPARSGLARARSSGRLRRQPAGSDGLRVEGAGGDPCKDAGDRLRLPADGSSVDLRAADPGRGPASQRPPLDDGRLGQGDRGLTGTTSCWRRHQGAWMAGRGTSVQRRGSSTRGPTRSQVAKGAGRPPSRRRAGPTIPVYGRAYPEAGGVLRPRSRHQMVAAAAATSIGAGQSLRRSPTPSTRRTTTTPRRYNCASLPAGLLRGRRSRTGYYQIWFGHRIAYVRAADVTIQDRVADARASPPRPSSRPPRTAADPLPVRGGRARGERSRRGRR